MASYLTTNSITWNFDKEVTLSGAGGTYQYGTYCNGDYWVIGPVTVLSISPSWNGSSNGAELNTIADGWSQGLRSSAGVSIYQSSRNVATSLPRTFQPSSSILSSRGTGGCAGVYLSSRTHITGAAVLTVLSSPPPSGSFRPGYAGPNTTHMGTESDIRYDRLARVAPTGGVPSMSQYATVFGHPRPAHLAHHASINVLPCGNGAMGYNADNGGDISLACLLANCDYTAAQKRDLVVAICQTGIDLFEIIMHQAPGGECWEPNGGHGAFTKMAIIFAGVVLDNAEMMAIGDRSGDFLGDNAGNPPSGYIHFAEDGQTFYVKQSDTQRGLGYTSGDIGLPEWGIRYSTYPNHPMATSSWNAEYRRCCTACSWSAGILAVHMMSQQGVNVKGLWNHDCLFDYMDRYISIEVQYKFSRYHQDDWVESMWNNYRAAYPPVWPGTAPEDTTPPLPPTSLVSPQQTESTISLSWTAGGQASDGDYPIGYRIYRDSDLIISVTGTTYTDTGLDADTSYDYDIYSYDDSNNQSSSAASNTYSTEEAVTPITKVFINGSGSSGNGGTSWSDAYRNLPSTLIRGTTYYIGTGNFGNYDFNDVPNSNPIIIQKATLSNHGSETGWNTAYAGLAQWGNLTFQNTSNIDFLGDAPTRTLIQHAGPSPEAYVVGIFDCSNIKIDYCDINGMNGGIGNLACTAFNMTDNSYIWIEHCYIHEAADDIIQCYTADHFYIRWNRIYSAYGMACGVGNGHSDAMELGGLDDSEIIGNLVYGIPNTSCLFLDNWTGAYCNNLLIANNIFYNNVSGVYFTVYLSRTTGLKFYNNIVWGSYNGIVTNDCGLAVEIDNSTLDVRNNICSGIVVRNGGDWDPSNTGDYNLVYGAPIGYETGLNDIIGADPKFTNIPNAGTPIANPTINDFAPLNETAPSVDNGTAIAEVSYDILHNGRPMGVAYDIGCFEYAGAIPTTGACCNTATGECSITTEAACAFNWLGAGSTCADCYTPIPTTGLVVSYPCGDLTGYTAADASGQETDGNLINAAAPGYSAGETNFIPTGEVEMLNIHDGIEFSAVDMQISRGTISCAIYPKVVTGVAAPRQFPARYLFGHTIGNWSNRIQFYIEDGTLRLGMGNTHTSDIDIYPIAIDTWYHAILTWLDNGITITNGTASGTPTGSGVWTVYVDAVEVATGTYTGLNSLGPLARFGNTGHTTEPYDEEGFEGYMDNLKVYDIPLSATEAADLAYNDSRVLVPDPEEIDPPIVINTAATSITTTSAVLGGEITNTGGEIPNVIVYYGETDEGEVAGSWDSSIDMGAVLSTFNFPLAGLTHNTTYFYRCYAANGGGSDWADSSETFDTLEITAPTLTQDAASNIGPTTVTLSGDITDDGNETPFVLVYFGLTDEGTTAANWDEVYNVTQDSSGAFSIDIVGLPADTEHFFRFYAENSIGGTWGSVTLDFTTSPTGKPTVVNLPATEIGAHQARIHGEVTDVGSENPTVTVYWGTDDGGAIPANWDNAASFGVQTGEFDVLLTTLEVATIYYYRAYATNAFGNDWANSSQSFSTLLVEPISPDPNDKIDGFAWGTYDNAYEIETPFVNEEIFNVHRVSRGDVTYLAHGNHFPQKLTRYGDKNWVLETIDIVGGPFLTENETEATTLQYVNGTGGTTGNYYNVDNTGTLTCSGDTPFLEEMVGSLFLLKHTRHDNKVSAADNHTHATPTGDGVRVQGDWQFDVSEMIAGDPNYTAKIWRRAVPGEWQEFKHFSAATLASGTEKEADVFYTWTDNNSTVKGVFTAENQINKGIVKITSFISTSSVSVIVKKQVYQESSTSPTTSVWAEGAWNDYRGYPKTVTFFGNRLWWASTTNNPQGLWGSRVGYYEDHTGGVVDDDAVSITISDNDVSSIEWISATQNFLVGSARKEYIVSAIDRKDPITPKDNRVKPHSTNGSMSIQPVEVGGGMLYAQRLGYKMLLLYYQYLDDAYDSSDTTRLAPHMFKYPAVDMAKQGTPETIVWITRTDGTLCPFRYSKDEEIAAWSRCVTGSATDIAAHAFISTAVVAGTTEDRIWTIVEREVDGEFYYYVERFADRNYETLADAMYLDSATTVVSDSQGTINRLYYLEGHTVTVMDGFTHVGEYKISAGMITGLAADTAYLVGLPYLCRMRTMAFAVPGVVTEGSIKRVLNILVRTVRTRDGSAGAESHDQTNTVDLDIEYSLDATDVEVFSESGFTKESRLVLDFSDPYPATVLAIVFEVELLT